MIGANFSNDNLICFQDVAKYMMDIFHEQYYGESSYGLDVYKQT